MTKLFGQGKTCVIAEIAQSYEGSFDDAKALIVAAAKTKADAVKFHVFFADELAVPSYEHYTLFRRLEFTAGQWGELAALAQSHGLLFAADVLGTDGLRVLTQIGADVLKIHATDMENLSLLRAVGATGKPVLLACGGATSGEIGRATKTLRDSGAREICCVCMRLHEPSICPRATRTTLMVSTSSRARGRSLRSEREQRSLRST